MKYIDSNRFLSTIIYRNAQRIINGTGKIGGLLGSFDSFSENSESFVAQISPQKEPDVSQIFTFAPWVCIYVGKELYLFSSFRLA